jgi:L-threonylcarbamoyladenylate synthase
MRAAPVPEIRRVRICRPGDLSVAAEWLRDGGIVAFPTDTFYGLAVDPASAVAVRRLFALKGREARAALPLVAASTRQVETLCGRLGSTDARLAARFWPGPLSLIFDAPAGIAPEAHAGRRSIAIRVPGHAVARSLCEAFGAPVTATSANRAGEPPAREAGDLGSLADDPRMLIVDGGAAPGGAPSTIVDTRGHRPVLVRDGAIGWERVLESLQE